MAAQTYALDRYDTILEVRKFNPYHDARGRFSTASGAASFTYKPGKSKAHDLAIQRMQAAAAAKPKPAPAPKTPPKPKRTLDARGFADHDDASYHQLYAGKKYYAQQKLTAKEQAAVTSYLQARPEPGSLYSHSQNMNWALIQSQGDPKKLAPSYRKTYDGMMSAMHNLGYNVTLTRYDHAGVVNALLQKLGAGRDYEKMSQKALQKALVGQTLHEDKFVSTSYNDFSRLPPSVRSVFESRAIKINYNASAKTQAMMPGVGPGGDFGEIVLAPGQAGRITAVRLTGQKVRRKGTQTYNQPRLEIDIEI